MKKLKVATAFSGGFGSVEFALKYLNIPHEIVFACEYAEPQRKSYISNHGMPTAEFCKDIKDLDGTKYKGLIDLYHLSPPCQSYSMSGNRQGTKDDRGGLMFEAIKSIDSVRPKMFTVENVKGLLSTNGGEDWREILHDFYSLKGYSISWGIMNAKHNGTPQNRVRVFIVGFRTDCDTMTFPAQLSLDKCVLDILEDEVDDKYYLSQKMVDGFTVNNNYKSTKVGYINQNTQASTVFDVKDIAPNLCAGTHGYANGYVLVKTNTKKGHEVAQIGDTIDLKGIKSKTRRGIINHQIAHCLDTQCYQAIVEPFIVASRGRNPKNPSDRTVGAPTKQRLEPNFSGCTNTIITVQKDNYLVEPNLVQIGNIDKKGRNTQSAKGGGCGAKTGLYLVGWNIRRLTPRECARLFGDFDDKFQFGEFKDTKLYEFIGNAIDINTYSRLLEQMLQFSQNIIWDEVCVNEIEGVSDECSLF